MNVELGPEIFRFTSFQQWVDKAQSWFRAAGVMSSQYVASKAADKARGK